MWANPQETADFDTFTKEIFSGKNSVFGQCKGQNKMISSCKQTLLTPRKIYLLSFEYLRNVFLQSTADPRPLPYLRWSPVSKYLSLEGAPLEMWQV